MVTSAGRPPTPPRRATVFVDADNTLWDTDQVYADAQLSLLEGVEHATGRVAPDNDHLAFVRAIDQAIAERHHSGLRYPPQLLVQALALVLGGETSSVAVRHVLKNAHVRPALPAPLVERIAAAHLAALRAAPKLRLGVKAGLERLHAEHCLILVVTEGARVRIERTIDALGLRAWIDRTVEAPKQTSLYRRVARLSRAPDPMFMVGDQLQRDIAPAKAAGLETIYFPGGFRPRWEPDEEAIQPDHRIQSFDQVASIVGERIAGPASLTR